MPSKALPPKIKPSQSGLGSKVTLRDVALMAGVSTSAVSRTFTQGASVSAKMRARVEKASQELDYSPNLLAQSLTTKRTKLIGLISDNYSNPVFLQVFDLFTSMLQNKGFRPLLFNFAYEDNPQNAIRMLKQYNVDGVIIASSTISHAFINELKNFHSPMVHTFGRFDQNHQNHVVGADNIQGGRLAAQFMQSKGYRRIAFLGGPKDASSTQDRLMGFTNELVKHQINLMKIYYADGYSYDAGRQKMLKIHHDLTDIDAIFCGDDLICIGAIDAAQEIGIQVPTQLGFLGFNDIVMANWGRFKLSTIHQPIKEITMNSVELIMSMLNNPDQPLQSRFFPCTIKDRDTLPQI